MFRTFNYVQEAQGELRRIDDETEVIVMRGSYEYIGADGLTYVVDWYADETGFHPSAPHLPQPVEIPFPEQQVAVEAQIRFAQEERARQATSASGRVDTVVSAPRAYQTSFQDALPTYN